MELQKLYVSLLMEMKEYTAGLDDAVDRARSFGDRLKGALGGAAMTAGLAVTAGLAAAGGSIVALGASSVGVAREFESSMAIMSTAVDPVSVGAQTTAEAMDILSEASLAVGSDTALVGVSASTSAEAITGLYKAGLSTSEIFGDLQGYMGGTAELSGALRASIDLAAASELDMVQASELAAITLATFGGHLETEAERAEFINSAMNNFVQTADGSVASVADLQAAFVNVGPSAAAMGMGVEEVNTALGILSTRGIVGSEAGTALKSMLVNLQRTTPDVTDTLDELGVSLYDAQGVMYELPEIIGQLEGAMAGMTDEQRQQTVATLAGSYGMNAMNALLGEGTEGWAAMEEAIGGAATMQETAAARTETLAGAQEALSGVWESFQIKVGTALIPVLTTLADIGSTLIERYGPTLTTLFENVGAGIQRIVDVIQNGQIGELFTIFEDGSSVLGGIFESFGMGEEQAGRLATGISNVVTAVQNFIAPVAEFVQNHGPLLLHILGGLAVAFGAFTIITTVVGWIGGLVGAIAGIGTAITAAGGGLTGLIAILGGPLTLVIGAVAAAVGLFAVAWRNDWGGIQEKVQEVIAVVRPLVEGWLTALSAWWSATWPQLQATLQTVWGVVQGVIQSAIAVIGPAVQGFIGSLTPVWEQLMALWPSLVGLWEAAQPVLLGVLTVIGAALVAVVGVVTGGINGLSQAIGPIVQGIIGAVEGIVTAVTGVFETLRGVFQLIVGLFTGNGELIEEGWQNLKDGIIDIVAGLVGGVSSLFSGLVDGIIGFVRGFVEGIVGFFQNLYDRLVGHSIVTDLVERIQALWEGLFGAVEAIVRAGLDVVRDVFSAFKALFSGDWEGFKDRIGEIWQEAWDAVVNIIAELWGNVQPKLVEWWDNIKGWFDEKTESLKQIGRDVIEGIVNGLDEVGDKIRETLVRWATEAWDKVKEFFGINSPSEKGKDAGRNIGEGFIEGILDTGDEFWGRTETVWQGYYERLEAWYEGLPWEEQPNETISRWQDGLTQLWPGLGPVFAEWYETLEEWYRDQEWESLPIYTTEVWAEEFGEMGERLEPVYEDYWLTTVYIFRGLDWAGIGVEIVNGIIAGVNAKSGDLYATLTALAREALAQAKAELRVASPSMAFYEVGLAIVDGLIAGIGARRPGLRTELDRLLYDLDSTLGAANDLGGLGSGFANLFEDRTIAPMEARLAVLEESIGGYSDSIAEMVERLGIDMSAPGWELMLHRFAESEYSSAEQRSLAQTALAFLRDRRALTVEQVELQAELAEQQARLARIEERRAEIGFLQQQLDLLELIRDNNLDMSILEGIELGLDADVGGLMDAMAEAMRAMIQAAEDELGVHSPSRWARETMQNVIGTMAATAARGEAELEESVSSLFDAAFNGARLPATVDGGGRVDNSRRVVVNGGIHNYGRRGEASPLEAMEVLMR